MIALFATIVVVTNIGFMAAYNTATRNPAWVSYDLEPGEVVSCDRAKIAFSADPRVPGTNHDGDFAGSGYDRGHLAPAADFNWSRSALRETYYYTNVSPQLPRVNRGAWLEIEDEVRGLASSGTVHVLTFPVIRGTSSVGRVSVPTSFVKIAWGYFGVRSWTVDNGGGGSK